MTPPSDTRLLRGLLAACHPAPCLAVTVFALAWTASILARHAPGAEARWGAPVVLVLVAVAVGAGQLSVGWSNDAWDADRDARADRTAKPVVAGLVDAATLWRAAVTALVVCVVASFALGPVAATAHLTGVACAWAYNLRLKTTIGSALPYAVAFGSLPSVGSGAAGLGWASWGPSLTGALLGVAAHLANTVADVDADARTGVRGFPQRLGPRHSMIVTPLLVAAAGLALLVGGGCGAVAVSSAATAVGVAVLATALTVSGRPQRAFGLVLVAVGLVVAGFVAAGP